jgi:hypothetical protein
MSVESRVSAAAKQPAAIAPQEDHVSAAASREHVAAPIDADDAAAALKRGPIGALILSAVSVGLLFIGWILFFFLLFMRRGAIG